MANPYRIDITARDKTAEAIKSVNDNFAKLAKGTPLEKINKSFSALTEKGRAFGELTKGFRGVGEGATLAAGGMGEAAGGLAALELVVGPLGIAIAAIGAGLGAAGTAANKFIIPMANAGAATGRTAFALGASNRTVQEFILAAAPFGVGADSMAAAMDGVNNAVYGAKWGTNAPARDELHRLGLTMHFLKDGSVDTRRELLDLASAFGKMNAQQREKAAGLLGVTSALPFLSQGYGKVKSAIDAVDRSGAVMTDNQIDKATRLHEALDKVHRDLDGIKNVGFSFGAGPLTGLLDFIGKGTGVATKTAQAVGDAPSVKVASFRASNTVFGAIAHAVKDMFHLGGIAPRAAAPGAHPAAGLGLFAGLERQFALPAGILDQVWRQESSRGKNMGPSPAGARGHFQFMPATAARYGLADPNNLAQSAAAAAHYLADLLKRYAGDPNKALAAYNWGEKHLDRDIGAHGADWRKFLPAETKGYLAEINHQLAEKTPAGKVLVDVHVHGAPAGSTVAATASGRGVTATAKISTSLPGGSA